MWTKGTAAAIGRSFDIYHRDAARAVRMRRLLGRFVGPGSLAFDIGAHVGDRTLCLAGLGARVVALEPQPAPFRALRLAVRRWSGIVAVPAAAGRRPGRARMYVNAENPSVSTLSASFLSAANGAPGWHGQSWDLGMEVQVVSLDALIAQHGRPDFVKIDVEGYEPDVLAGLSWPVASLSFEVTSVGPAAALASVERLEALGSYRYNFSLGETHRLRHDRWVTADVLRRDVERLSHAENSGDVYAMRSDGP